MRENNKQMQLLPQEFIFWNGILVGVIILSYFLFRKARSPRLILTSKRSLTPKDQVVYRPRSGVYNKPKPDEAPPTVHTERGLNVVFNYNGHSWDAYEVLGVPAGSSYESAKAAYDKLLPKLDPDSKLFMQAALEAIAKLRGQA